MSSVSFDLFQAVSNGVYVNLVRNAVPDVHFSFATVSNRTATELGSSLPAGVVIAAYLPTATHQHIGQKGQARLFKRRFLSDSITDFYRKSGGTCALGSRAHVRTVT